MEKVERKYKGCQNKGQGCNATTFHVQRIKWSNSSRSRLGRHRAGWPIVYGPLTDLCVPATYLLLRTPILSWYTDDGWHPLRGLCIYTEVTAECCLLSLSKSTSSGKSTITMPGLMTPYSGRSDTSTNDRISRQSGAEGDTRLRLFPSIDYGLSRDHGGGLIVTTEAGFRTTIDGVDSVESLKPKRPLRVLKYGNTIVAVPLSIPPTNVPDEKIEWAPFGAREVSSFNEYGPHEVHTEGEITKIQRADIAGHTEITGYVYPLTSIGGVDKYLDNQSHVWEPVRLITTIFPVPDATTSTPTASRRTPTASRPTLSWLGSLRAVYSRPM